MSHTSFVRARNILIGSALSLRLVVAWFNYGILASDDHDHILVHAVPAQRVEGVSAIVSRAGVRSPVPALFIYSLGQLAWGLRLTDPINQVRFIYSVLGLLSMLSVWLAWKLFEEAARHDWAMHATLWTGLHFLAVFVSTRALTETMAAPFLTGSAVALVYYVHRARRSWLLWSVSALALASLFRFQCGVCLVVVVAAPVIRRAWKDLLALVGTGLALFVLTGWADYLLRGGFHVSLRRYLAYNLDYASTYGVSHWYNYLLLLLAVSLPPLLVARYRGFPWRRYLRLSWPVLATVSVFVVAHSAVSHKEDRFLIPVLPLYLALLAPLSAWLFSKRPRSWRSAGFVAVNLSLVLLLARVPSQNNIIAFVRYLDGHPSIHQVWALGDSLVVYPTAYGSREPPPLRRVNFWSPRRARYAGCDTVLVVREDVAAPETLERAGVEEVGVFEPGVLERVLTWANREKNARRSALHAYLPAGCRVAQ